METEAPWPTNRHGTQWRHSHLYFDWRDEEIVWEAIEAIGPLMITVCSCRPVAAIGFDKVADMVMHRLAETLPSNSKWNNEGMCVTIDPCVDPDALRALVREEVENVQFSIFGVAMLDLADQATYQKLLTALEDRWEQFLGEAPIIEF